MQSTTSCFSHLINWEYARLMCLIVGESKTTYVTHKSKPAIGGEQDKNLLHIRRIWLHLFLGGIAEIHHDNLTIFLTGTKFQGTKDNEWEQEKKDWRGREQRQVESEDLNLGKWEFLQGRGMESSSFEMKHFIHFLAVLSQFTVQSQGKGKTVERHEQEGAKKFQRKSEHVC